MRETRMQSEKLSALPSRFCSIGIISMKFIHDFRPPNRLQLISFLWSALDYCHWLASSASSTRPASSKGFKGVSRWRKTGARSGES